MAHYRKRPVAPIEQMYLMGLEPDEIALRLGYSLPLIGHRLREAGIHTRDRLGRVAAARKKWRPRIHGH